MAKFVYNESKESINSRSIHDGDLESLFFRDIFDSLEKKSYLTEQEILELVRLIQQSLSDTSLSPEQRDTIVQEAQQKIVLGLAISLRKMITKSNLVHSSQDVLDVMQIGSIGLLKALKKIEKFDPEKGTAHAYLLRCMKNEIFDAYRKEERQRGTVRDQFSVPLNEGDLERGKKSVLGEDYIFQLFTNNTETNARRDIFFSHIKERIIQMTRDGVFTPKEQEILLEEFNFFEEEGWHLQDKNPVSRSFPPEDLRAIYKRRQRLFRKIRENNELRDLFEEWKSIVR